MKKMLSLVIAFCLILGMLPTAAFAADQTSSDAGIRIQYVEDSYDAETGYFLVNVQAKIPSGKGVSSLGVTLSYDNNALTLVHNRKDTEYAGTENTTQSVKGAINSMLADLDADDEDADYVLQNYELYRSGNRNALYTYMYTTSTVTGSMNDGDWFNCFQLRFKTAGDPESVMNSDSLRIADAAKDDDVIRGAFPANDIYSVYLTDNSDPAKIYCYNKMSGNNSGEASGALYMMTAEGTGTATYPGSTNSPSQGEGGGDEGETTTSNYEIYYTLNSTAGDDAFKDYDFTVDGQKQVEAEIFLVSKEAAVTVQAYDIYLTYNGGLVYNGLSDMAGKPYEANATDITDVAAAKDTVAHIQLVAAENKNISLTKGVAQSLGKIIFDIDANAVTYGDELPITLTGGTNSKTVTNISVANTATVSTAGDTTSYYPVVTQTVTVNDVTTTYSGAEIITKHDVTFNTNGGSDVVKQEVGHNLTANKPSDPSKPNHSFEGWFADEGLTTAYTFNEKVTADITIYAKWEATAYTVNWYDADNGLIYSDTINSGETTSFDENTYTKPSKAPDEQYTYTFKGWIANDTPELNGKIETFPYEITASTNFYPVFSTTTVEYEVKYMPETGDTALHTEQVAYGDNPTWTAGKATKTGDAQYSYEFLGWTETPNPAFEAAVVDLATFKVKKATTFYPVFKQITNSYTVTYNPGQNGTFDEEDALTETVPYGSNPKNDPTVTANAGYEFVGWFDTTNKVAVENIKAYQVKGDVTLTAQYKGKEITVKFDGNGADTDSPTMQDQTWTYGTDFKMPANTFVKTYWTFNGWNTKSDGSGTSYTVGNKYNDLTTEDEITLYAQWTQADLTITYAKNLIGGSVGGDEAANHGDTITVNVAPLPGYNVGEVTYTPDGSTAQKIDANENGEYIFTMPDKNVTVSATFTAINYTVQVDTVNNGSVTIKTDSGDVNKIEDANVGEQIVLNVTANNGYEIESVTFTKDGETAGTPATKNDDGTYSFEMPASDVTVSATFKGKTYEIKYNSNGGDGTMSSGSGTFGTTTTLAANAFDKTGYEFKGWTTTVGEETVTVSDKGSFNPDTYAESYTMTAIWEAKKVNVILDYGYDNKTSNLEVVYGSTYAGLEDAERDGYTFKGWFDGETPVTKDTGVTNTEAHTLTAKWEVITYTITYELDTGSFVEGSNAPSTYDVTKSVTLPVANDVNRNGYIFKGWYEKSDADKKVVTEIKEGTTGDKIYCAKWELDSYTITFELGSGKWPSSSTMTGNTMNYDYTTPVTLPAAESTDPMYEFAGWSLAATTESWKDTNYTAGTNYGQGHYGDITLTAVYGPAVKYEVEEYKYADDGWYLLRVKDTFGTDTTQTYKFGDETMFYTTDENYRIDTTDAGAFYLLINASDLDQEKLNSTTDKALVLTASAYDKIQPATADRATIDYNGDINNDTVLNIADANIIYQMVEQASEGSYYSMDQLKNDRRLEADMAKATNDTGNLHRASIADVHEIVNLINKAN